jgi:hypothetical protein
MKQIKVFVAANAVVVMAFAGFWGSIYAYHYQPGVGFAKPVNAFCRGLYDGFHLSIIKPTDQCL